ncbi:MAG: 1,4-dihydroxy-2-naphthoate octaprenyltransferase [Bacteroidaceae bacterium]|nr:1,4-dihydroxy-2-naphthoate octaprenyltransferase [Bacteroidaceae bacterium]
MNVRTNSVKAWVLAARPKTLSAALIPVMVAAALASHAPQCSWAAIVICALFAALMQIAANLINDLLDFRKGTDGTDRLGPERACAQGWITPRAMRIGIAVVLALALICGSLVLSLSPALPSWEGSLPLEGGFEGGWIMVALGAACVLFAFLYTSWLSYAGLGDLLVLVFFGFVPCCGTYFAATGTLCTSAWIAGLICGVLIDTLLIINNYRDRDTDHLSGKKTLIATFGEKFGRYFYLACGIAAWGLTSLLPSHWEGMGAGFTLPYLLLHIITWRQMVRIRQGRELNHILGLTSRNMLIFGVLLTVALAI